MPYSSQKLAEIIVNTLYSDLEKSEFDHSLIQYVKSKNLHDLTLWLNLHSYLKYMFDQQLKDVSDEATQGEIIKKIIFDYLGKKQSQKQKKFTAADLDGHINIKKLEETAKNINSRSSLNVDSIRMIIQSFNRIYPHFNGAVLVSPCQEDELTKYIQAVAIGERKQFIYRSPPAYHFFGFDVERKQDGTLSIFCFDSSHDPIQYITLDHLAKKLQLRNEKFVIKSGGAGLQKDSKNCSLFAMMALKEFSKYDHVFDYLSTSSEIRQAPFSPDQNYYNVLNGSSHRFSAGIGKIEWVNLTDLPLKIMSMSQSYFSPETGILTLLEKAKKSNQLDQDLNAQSFIDFHLKRYLIDRKNEENYINKKRQKQFSTFSNEKKVNP